MTPSPGFLPGLQFGSWIVGCLVSTFFCCSVSMGQNWEADADARIEQHRKADLEITVVDASGIPIQGANVDVTMLEHEFHFGSAVVASRIMGTGSNNAVYRQKILENFNSIVFENDLKWPPWIGLWGNSFNWPQTQQALDWCDANNLIARGHYLSWGTWSGVDAWGDDEDESTLEQRLHAHITDIATTVGTRVYEWDVLNHPIGWLNDTYETRFGSTFYRDIINHARSVVPPGVDLWINEDGILASGSRANEYERVIELLNSQGAPIDGIGFQAHFIEAWGAIQTPEHVYQQLERFSLLSPRLRITELDIDVGSNESYQGQLMHDYLKVSFSHPNLEAITLWGFWQNSHWRPDAGLYRGDWSEKPALTSYQNLVFNDWWTDESGITDSTGKYETRAFRGTHLITINHDGQTHRQEISLGANGQAISVTMPGTYAMFVGQGLQVGGTVSDLEMSDNNDVSIQRSVTDVQSRVSIEVKSASPVPNPDELGVRVESSVFARTAVNLTIELFNYTEGQFEEVYSADASRFVDSNADFTETNDAVRFVDSGTCEVLARVSFQSTNNPRQRFTANVDMLNWSFE